MIRRCRRSAAALIVAASLIVLGGCGSSTHLAIAKTSPLPPTPATSDLLLTTADLPTGFTEFTPHVPSRPFCGKTPQVKPTSEVRVDFVMPTNSHLYEIRDRIATYASASVARQHFEEGRSFLVKSCHRDVTAHGHDTISVVPTPPLGADSLGVRQDVTGMPPIGLLGFSTMVGYSYYVLAGSSIIEVGLIDAPLLKPNAGAAKILTTPDLTLLKKLTLLQLKRFKTRTPSTGMAA